MVITLYIYTYTFVCFVAYTHHPITLVAPVILGFETRRDN